MDDMDELGVKNGKEWGVYRGIRVGMESKKRRGEK